VRLSPNALVIGDDIRAVLTRGPEENMRALTAQVIEFVESEQYLRFADRVEQAADKTLYTVWVAWDAASRKQVLVRLGQVDGIGLQGARVVGPAATTRRRGLRAGGVGLGCQVSGTRAGRAGGAGVSLALTVGTYEPHNPSDGS